MRILFLGNNWLAWQVLNWLRSRQEEIIGLVIHPAHRRKYGEEMLRSVQLESIRIFDGATLGQARTIEAIRALKPDLGISVLFGYILKPEFLNLFPLGCINVHLAWLPYNRGVYPDVWSIVEETPAGVTLHYMDAGIDTGDIIAQREVEVEAVDTARSLYSKLERVGMDLFAETWQQIRSRENQRIPQNTTEGTYHALRDVERIDEIDLHRSYSAKELIDLMRARTFTPYRGAYFRHQGKRVYLQLELLHEDEIKEKESHGKSHRN